MIHDLDVIDALIAQLQSETPAAAMTFEFVRVWAPMIYKTELKPGQAKVQLWSVEPVMTKPFRGAPFQLTSCKVGVQFALACESQTREEIDQLFITVDQLILATELDAVIASRRTDDGPETERFYRANEITWSLRPNAEHLTRIEPTDEAEKYSGTVQAQCLMEYRRNV